MIESKYRAPWGKLLVAISIIATAIILVVSVVLMSPTSSRVQVWPSVVNWLPLLLLFSTLPFVIRGYRVGEGILFIDRLFWATEIPLHDLESVEVVPNAMKGGLRLCGNGGLYSFSGWWWSRKLGHFRPFVTDLNRTVVLKFSRRTVIVSPENPEEFARDLAGLVTSRES